MSSNFEYYGIPPTLKGQEYRLEEIATSGKTTFISPYTVGMVDVYVQGVLLSSTDYTATDGTNVILNRPCVAGEVVKVISRSTALVSLANTYSQEQADARFATIASVNTKADASLVPKRGRLFFMGNL